MKEPKTVDFDIQPGAQPDAGKKPADDKEEKASYFGPDRRKGPRDRRSGNDRRESIRMGDDRRQNRGRRDYDQDVWDQAKDDD